MNAGMGLLSNTGQKRYQGEVFCAIAIELMTKRRWFVMHSLQWQ